MSSPITFVSAGSPAASSYGAGAPPNLQRAKLSVHKPPQAGSTAKPGAFMYDIPFQFNPKELSLSKNAKWKRDEQRNAKKSGPPEFKGADPVKLALEMFLDATDTMDDKVVKTVEKVFTCCVATEESRQSGKGSPPWVVFKWGGMTGFPAYVASVTAKYTLFTPAGVPVRAVCTVNLEEISGEQGGQNPTSGTRAVRSTHTLVAGDTLQSVAFTAYGDPRFWRDIAELNDIDDPMVLRPGTRLRVPALEEISRGQ
ncbi:LysM peptidoglycan-binding domain-containing protein [Actinokineospora globicatena]|uniref:Peptidase M23 n=1 Tax=Actinokineospora globicatena TaxID=103729 RepID=A0A9W6QFF8_9PSEU|nr:LysM peptidoglycan-binding domain-containing protein [Actinokineospora globicatena]MCP2306431.1 LysM domain-containing protein [Actinokineospora globicatena]GLW81855.1 peptidase M23 [Actinokineospora globicatena]GLW88649.1 peptidase M23 [Actinokineospora globicatena]GLW89468.1 peptidase M23 [Actinokineospora globicatena]